MKSSQMIVGFLIVIVIGGGYGLGRIANVSDQTSRIEQKLDLTVEQQKLREIMAKLINYCDEQAKGFRSLACVNNTEILLRSIVDPTFPRRTVLLK